MAEALVHVAGFAERDVHVLLDPAPERLRERLDEVIRSASQDTLLFFYYSGHADDRALFPGGRALAFDALRGRLDDDRVGVRIGVIDTCRGGGWTGTKGLEETELFQVNIPMSLSNDGSVLIASSSGLEDAHETEDYQGEFFTHHWNAALRGAADENADVDTGLVVLEIPEGERAVRVAVKPGRYLVRSRVSGEVRAREIVVRPDRATTIREDQLEAVGRESATVRAYEPRPVNLSTLPKGFADLRIALGVLRARDYAGVSIGDESSTLLGLLQGAYGITGRFQWSILTGAFAYRGGETGGFEWIPWAGLTSLGLGFSSVEKIIVRGDVGAGSDFKLWLSPNSGIIFGAGLRSRFRWSSGDIEDRNGDLRFAPTSWRSHLRVGYASTIDNVVSLGLGVQYAQHILYRGGFPKSSREFVPALRLGSVLDLGLRSLPLIRLHVYDSLSIDGYVSVEFDFVQKSVENSYMAGATFVW